MPEGLEAAVAVAAGDEHTCAVTATGNAWPQGTRHTNEMGSASHTTHTATPAGLESLSMVMEADLEACFICPDVVPGLTPT